jgi:hypothetical protein
VFSVQKATGKEEIKECCIEKYFLSCKRKAKNTGKGKGAKRRQVLSPVNFMP